MLTRAAVAKAQEESEGGGAHDDDEGIDEAIMELQVNTTIRNAACTCPRGFFCFVRSLPGPPVMMLTIMASTSTTTAHDCTADGGAGRRICGYRLPDRAEAIVPEGTLNCACFFVVIKIG